VKPHTTRCTETFTGNEI